MEALIYRTIYDQELADRELKTLDEAELVERLFLTIQPWATIEEQRQIAVAVELASYLHEPKKYGDGPYIRHPLRVAARIASKFEVKDANVIIASLLHDTVEDHEDELSALASPGEIRDTKRETCFAILAGLFSEDVEHLVRGVTNPDFGPNLTKHEFHIAYQAAIVKKVEGDGRVGLVKLSDWFDNGVGLHHSPGEEFQLQQAPKYLSLAQVFSQEVESGNIPIPIHRKARVLGSIAIGEARLQEIADRDAA